ncbi:hypothetical protein QAD02_003388 [Eretmocerus hayati]|uniref:Uncharacterized protein n=1 Tax=Eretmocerus hayati TaxID=131215 RepID=A0ACC2NLL1_9HYME|nr:hypothetical protein QAD02_003388 [Eretmocerus hayati]
MILVYIPEHEKPTLKENNYKELRELVENPLTKPCIEFVAYSSKILTKQFTLIMQKSEPLIHKLHTQLHKLVYTLSTLFLHESAIPKNVLSASLKDSLENRDHLLDSQQIKCGSACSKSVESMSNEKKLVFLNGAKACFPLMVGYLLFKVKDLSNLKYFECLAPEKIRNARSGEYICRIANLLPLDCVDTNDLSIEWNLLQVDDDVTYSLKPEQRIDCYWYEIFCLKSENVPRYPNITHVVKAALSLVHGSADVERGFSKSGKILTKDKTKMCERTLNAKLAIAEGLKQYDMKSWKVPMTSDLLLRARKAHSSYVLRREQEKKEAEEKAKKRKIDSAMQEEHELALRRMKTEVENIRDQALHGSREKYVQTDIGAAVQPLAGYVQGTLTLSGLCFACRRNNSHLAECLGTCVESMNSFHPHSSGT